MEAPASAQSIPETLDVKKQKDVYKTLQSHFDVIFNAPCRYFPGYPFAWKDGEDRVYIKAIIEHFGDEQQKNLIASCNAMLAKKAGLNRIGTSRILLGLKASKLQRAEGGIQFEVPPPKQPHYHRTPEENVMENLAICNCAQVWKHIKTYPDFTNRCQIRYDIRSFGDTDIKVVYFDAYHGLPIFIMLWLLRKLHVPHDCDLGQVIVTDSNGLPGEDADYHLHFSSGIVNWD